MRQIRLWPDPVLRKPTRGIYRFNSTLARLADEMLEITRQHRGLGLSAPQIGLSVELMTVIYQDRPYVFVNPYPVTASRFESAALEGCLSIPGKLVRVPRSIDMVVRYQDVDGDYHILTASNVFARAIQHEMDHLDGVLILDYEEAHTWPSGLAATRARRAHKSGDRLYPAAV